MQQERINALILRHIWEMPRDLYRMLELVFYPVLDIIIWGFMGRWVQEAQRGDSSIGILLPASLVLWMIVERTQSEISLNFIEEVWSHNIVNLFVTPLKLSEWLISSIILGIFKGSFIFSFSSLILWVLLGINIFNLGVAIIPLLLLLALSGLTLGIFICSIIVRYGRRVSSLIWSFPYLILSFSAVFYPQRLLPIWAQYISHALPTSYIFEALRTLIATGNLPIQPVITACIIVIVYFIGGLFLLRTMFKQTENLGLARLESE